MSSFIDKLRLKERAEEDLYFAKQDRELIHAMHKKSLAKCANCSDGDDKKQAEKFEKRFESVTDKHRKKRHKLLQSYRTLLEEVKAACKKRH